MCSIEISYECQNAYMYVQNIIEYYCITRIKVICTSTSLQIFTCAKLSELIRQSRSIICNTRNVNFFYTYYL